MPQTMLGLLALVLASFVAFNQQRLTQQSYRNAVRDEVEIAAAGTAQHVVEMIAARSYDEASTPVRVFQSGGVPMGTSLFSGGANFTVDRGNAGCNLMDPVNTPDCDDVDDAHGLRDVAVEARLSDGRSLPFAADIDVFYVAGPSSTTPSSLPTLHKRVEVTLRSPLLPDLPNGVMTVSRVISYDPIKAEADMETLCGPIGMPGSPCGTGTGGTVEGPG